MLARKPTKLTLSASLLSAETQRRAYPPGEFPQVPPAAIEAKQVSIGISLVEEVAGRRARQPATMGQAIEVRIEFY